MGKVLLIGWDGADWEMINPLLDGGELPHLSKVVESGVIGNLATLSPCLSPILWTSIATGRTADQHGILGFIEPTEDGLGVRPASSVSRRCKALWNIASQRDLKSVVVGWYATQPAEPINGVCVSDVAVQLDWGSVGQRLPMADEGVWPPRVSELADWLRIHPFEIEASDLLGLIPSVAEIDLKIDPKPLRLAEVLARDYTVHAVATALLETEPWDFAAVYYPGLDTAGHFFMPYHPPQMAHIEDRDYTLYKDVMCGLYRAYDQMLGRMMEIAGPDVHIVVVSDHGFHSGNRRPLISSHGATPHAEAAQWHRGWGIVAMQGPMIVADDRVYGATLLDIAPTILALLGLPGDKTMPGNILTQAFRVPDFLEPLPDWESEPGECGMHAEDKRSDTLAAASAILQLQNLGYLSALPNGSHSEETSPALVRQAIRESQINLAGVYVHQSQPAKAITILETLLVETPDDERILIAVAKCHHQLQNQRGLQTIIKHLDQLGIINSEILLLKAGQYHADRDAVRSRHYLQAALAMAPGQPEVPLRFGELFVAQQDWENAETAFRESLKLDAMSARCQHKLAIVCLTREDYPSAIESARTAVGLKFFFPTAHYHLGLAYHRIGQNPKAIKSLKVALKQQPEFPAARDLLIALYQKAGQWIAAMQLQTPTLGA
jgi:tetratricopeptide (TPR) repeat protein